MLARRKGDLLTTCEEVTDELIPSILIKGVSNDLVTFVRGMNIGRRVAHPGILADMRVRYSCPSEGTKDVHNDTKRAHITGKVLVEHLREWYRIRTDILKGIIVVHHHEVACYLAVHHQGCM